MADLTKQQRSLLEGAGNVQRGMLAASLRAHLVDDAKALIDRGLLKLRHGRIIPTAAGRAALQTDGDR